MSSTYLAAGSELVSDGGCCQLFCTSSVTCVVRWTYSNCGCVRFAAAEPELWNSISVHLKPNQRTSNNLSSA